MNEVKNIKKAKKLKNMKNMNQKQDINNFSNKKRSINKLVVIFSSVLISILLIIVLSGLLIINKPSQIQISEGVKASIDNKGDQVITLKAKDGFSPKVNLVDANKPSILRVSTLSTTDCSATLNIPKLSINEVLPFSGVTNIEIPKLASGETLDGTCSGGIYSFKIIAQ